MSQIIQCLGSIVPLATFFLCMQCNFFGKFTCVLHSYQGLQCNVQPRWYCAPCICIYNYLCILIVHPDQLLWCMHMCVFVSHLYQGSQCPGGYLFLFCVSLFIHVQIYMCSLNRLSGPTSLVHAYMCVCVALILGLTAAWYLC